MTELRAIIFDVDGTLVDSQAEIYGSVRDAFASFGRPVPPRQEVLARVGLSLEVFMADLMPDLPEAEVHAFAERYKSAYAARRTKPGAVAAAPLFDGIRNVLEGLKAEPWTLLAVATGKSRRGLKGLLDGHDLQGFFQAQQTADDHPSKPHPAMLEAALGELGVTPDRAIMVGDTSFDMEMGRAAGCATIGVSWGYHAADRLVADRVVDQTSELPAAIDSLLGHAS